MMYSKFAIPDMQFFITKINGADVCSLSTEEAVQLFLDASDPILIEVYRKRIPNCSNKQVDASEAAKCDPVNRLSIVAEKDSVIHPKQSMLSARIGYCTASTNLLQRDDSMDSCAEEVASSSSSKKQHLTLYFPPPPPLVLNDNTSYNDCTHGDMENAVSVSDAISNTVEYAYRDDSIYQPQPPPAPSLPQDIDESDITDKPQLISTAMQTEVSNFVSLFHVANASTTDQMIEEEHNLFEACLAPEIDIEEITLRKSDSNEHLGLTVCYSMSGSTGNGSGTCQAVNDITSGLEENESCTEVFISDIQPDSIAARDGRLRQGDQILQVNGKDVTNKKETETLIAENNNAVTLLVSRYLYADEDDFNDTCVAGLDVDDEEDDEDEEFYDENNLTYENCFISSNECSTTADSQLNRVLLAASPPQITTSVMTTPTAKIATTTTTTLAATPNLVAAVSATTTNKHDDAQARSNSSTTSAMTLTSPIKTTPTVNTKNKYYSRGQLLLKYDPLNHQSIKAHLKQVNQELAMLDCRVENLMIKPQGVVGTTTLALDHVDYDTEHIYETIPEDSESEPFYCSPYESSSYVGPSAPGNNQNPCTEQVHLQQQKQRVVAWLGMQTAQRTHHFMNTNGRSNTIVQYPHGIPPMETSMSGTTTTLSTRSKSGTVRSAATNTTTGTTGSSSSGGGFGHNEQDNSSSAYNTGGSNNSSTALTLVLNQSNTRMNNDACDMDQQLSALRISKSQRLISPKDKLTSPKHQNAGPTASSLIKIPGPSTTRAAGIINSDIAVPPPPSRSQQQQTQTGSNQQISTNTMYTNVANLQQTMLLQQQLFRQALTQQQQSHSFNFQPQQHLQENTQQSLQLHACPQFTAPNLSQYHFVSSQEGSPEKMRVAAVAAAKASSTEVPMVWKVKRRQDGTRYIVRRPARTRMLRDRALRINAERENYDLTTTEDDTISEIKTGRYWTREERKKHIERARERRQQQQQQLATVTTMRIGDKPIAELPIASSKCQVPKEKPQITVGQQNVSKLHRQASAKLQHHQLQFGSTAPHTADIQTATSLGSCPKVTTALLSSGCIKQKLLSNKNSINKTNNSCSQGEPSGLITPSNVAVPEVNGLEQLSSAATSNANGNSITPTANISGVVVTGAAVQPGQQYQQQQAVALSQTTVGNNKMGLLSVTTV